MEEYFNKFDKNLRIRAALLKAQRTDQLMRSSEIAYINRKLVLLATLIRLAISLNQYCSTLHLNYFKIYDVLEDRRNITEFDFIKIKKYAKQKFALSRDEFRGDPNIIYKKYIRFLYE